MEKRWLQVSLACAAGGGIGALFALIIGLWWLGALMGGLISYLTFEFKTVKAAISFAWASVWMRTGKKLQIAWQCWKPNWKLIGKCWLLLFGVSSLVSFYFMAFFHFFAVAGLLGNKALGELYLSSSIPSIMSLVLFMVMFSATLSLSLETKKEESCQLSKKIIKHGNPFSVCFWIFIGIIWCIVKVPRFIMLSGQFIKTVFVLIHSDFRLLCFIDGFFGASIGYFIGKALGPIVTYVLAGALSGGIIGLINYWWVSIKLLKLNSAKS